MIPGDRGPITGSRYTAKIQSTNQRSRLSSVVRHRHLLRNHFFPDAGRWKTDTLIQGGHCIRRQKFRQNRRNTIGGHSQPVVADQQYAPLRAGHNFAAPMV